MSTNASSSIQNYEIFVSTWNVGGLMPEDITSIELLLDIHHRFHDIYVFGLQEIVALNPRNVLMAEESRRVSAKWKKLVGAALNKIPSTSCNDPSKIHPLNDAAGGEIHPLYECVAAEEMVGVLLSVWVRADLRPHIRRQAAARVGCGIFGVLGNKGAVSARFELHGTSFCFVCCHLASGEKEGDERRRNRDAVGIFTRTRFGDGDFRRTILEHERVILLGDLNYRISRGDGEIRAVGEEEEWGRLKEKDQLRVEMGEGGSFEGWREGGVGFPPTYKYRLNSDDYCRKSRSPAWCDRILWRGKGLLQRRYENVQCCTLSDHRPVRAIFAAEIRRR